MALASTYGLSAYDAAYLDVAMQEGIFLATQDQKLLAAATAAGVEIME
jgi:predicted nucleic acid-binding protein